MLYRNPIEHNYTLETRISRSDTEAIAYLSDLLTLYGREKRYAVHRVNNGISDSKLNTEMQKHFHVSKRSANSVMRDVKASIKSVKELREYNISQTEGKITSVKDRICELKDYINGLKPLAESNKLSEKQLLDYRKAKQNLYQQKQKLNRLEQRIESLKQAPDTDICFGSKKLFRQQYHLEENGLPDHKAWRDRFVAKRDSYVEFLGCAEEPCGNQNCQLTYDNVTGAYKLRIRKEYCLGGAEKVKPGDDNSWLTIKDLRFRYREQELRDIVTAHKNNTGVKNSVTIRILRRDNKWYVQVMISTVIRESRQWNTDSHYGVLSADFNEDFVEITELDRYGNLRNAWHYDLPGHKNTKEALNGMREFAAWFTDLAISRHKDIAIEDLSFKGKKAKTIPTVSKSGKKYNRMIHALDYRRYVTCLENTCGRKGILLKKVNPAYTSQIGRQKYADRMKLTVHRAAAYVIGRRAMGFHDALTKETKRQYKYSKTVKAA